MRAICAIVASLVLAGTAFADTINVPDDQPTIAAAISASVNGDVIAIAAGVYYEANLNPGGKAITIGSASGNLDVTIDAQQGGSVFVITSGEGSGTVIKDLLLTGGHGTLWGSIYYGGGIYLENSNATIIGCTISDNTADYGGGICCSSSNATITSCTIEGNTTVNYNGGGIACFGSNATITNCTIEGNTTDYNGGGIYCYHSSPTITGCTISDNTAVDSGGGIYCYLSSDPTITGCTITGNEADYGGGIYCNLFGNPTITGCIISGNTITIEPPSNVFELDGYRTYFNVMNSPSDRGFLAATLVLDLWDAGEPLGNFTGGIPVDVPIGTGLGGPSTQPRRQIPHILEAGLFADFGANSGARDTIPTGYAPLPTGGPLAGMYAQMLQHGRDNQQWFTTGGTAPTEADMEIMLQIYENYLQDNPTVFVGEANIELARTHLTASLQALYQTNTTPGFTPYGQALLNNYVADRLSVKG